jgi:hypothetical protein
MPATPETDKSLFDGLYEHHLLALNLPLDTP